MTGVGLYRAWRRGRNKLAALGFAGSFGSFGAHSVFELPIELEGEARIFVGNDVWLGWRSRLIVEPTSNACIRIGDGCKSSGTLSIEAHAPVVLGRKVLLASNVALTTRPYLAHSVSAASPVSIGDGSWIGENVVIQGGVHIGKGAVIGANSVVTTDVPDHAVAVGAPARVVREQTPLYSRVS